MPLKSYGVLKGRVIDSIAGEGRNPHYEVHVVDDDNDYRIAINVESRQAPSELSFLVDEAFEHPITDLMAELKLGFKELESEAGGLALDFIRGNLFHRDQLTDMPFGVAGPEELEAKLDHYVNKARGDADVTVYAFGQFFKDPKKDPYFGFKPGNGIHDIHMNQGNTGSFQKDNGVYQDGALFLQFPRGDGAGSQWVAIFLKFQSQAWHTNDQTGNAISGRPDESRRERADAAPAATPPTAPPAEAGPAPHVPDIGPGEPDFRVRIVAARVRAAGGGPEEVTLLNASPVDVDLNGWALLNKSDEEAALQGTVAAGATTVVKLDSGHLSNSGDTITLVDAKGLKVHGVAYTKAQAKHAGWTLVF